VEDHPALGSSLGNGPVQGQQSELYTLALAQTSAQYLPGVFVHDRRHVTPLVANLEVSNITDPDLIRTIDHNPQGAVGHTPKEGVVGRVSGIQVGRPGFHAVFSHQAGYPFLGNLFPLMLQRRMYPGAAIGITTLFMDSLYFLQQPFLFLFPITGLSVFPVIVTGSGDAIGPALGTDAELFPVLLYEREDFPFRSEQNRMAFFSISCSSLSRA